LEGGVRSVDGNRHCSLGGLGFQIGFVSRYNVGVGSLGGTRVGRVVLALVRSGGGVRVARFSVDTTVGDDVGHSLCHQTTVASLVSLSGRAVNQVLIGVRDQLASGESVAAFHRASGGERPAGTALLLVLDSGDDALVSPVEGGLFGLRGYVHSRLYGGSCSEEDSLVFSIGQVSQVVQSNLVCLGGVSVVSVNKVKVSLEDRVSVLELIMVVGLLLLLHPLSE